MAYRWRLDGPAFEFPTPYSTENRFLRWRGYALIALAVLIVLVVLVFSHTETDKPLDVLDKLPEPASVWPHLIAAALLVLWGVLDLLQASRQGVLLLAPGQPASLMAEVSREASGASAGMAWLTQALGRGVAQPPELGHPYLRWLRRLGPDLAAAPTTLHAYLRVRMSHLVLGSGLLALVLLALAVPRPLVAVLTSLLAVLAGGVVVLRHVLYPDRHALRPLALPVIAALVLVLGAVPGWFGDALPLAEKLQRLALPTGALVLLASVLLFELLGLQAARVHIDLPRPGKTGHDEATASFDVSPVLLFREIDRELDRRWSEGVPNRRYAWMPPKVDSAVEEGGFAGTVLEESQPQMLAEARGSRAAEDGVARRRWLLTLDVLGLAWTVLGGSLWVYAAWAHMQDSGAPWTSTAVGLACVLAGGYSLRVAHLLWSRIEVLSTITWLDLKGAYFRLPVVPGVAEPAGWQRNEPAVGVDELTLRSCVVQARSVFFAAGTYELGSRVLLGLTASPATAAVWTTLLQDFARKSEASPAATTPAALAARAQARARRQAQPEAGGQPRRPAKFCSACGTPVLAGARFCQQCGNTLAAD